MHGASLADNAVAIAFANFGVAVVKGVVNVVVFCITRARSVRQCNVWGTVLYKNSRGIQWRLEHVPMLRGSIGYE